MNNQQEKPLVSIIILNYNAGDLLINCVNSVFKSNYENFEVIVVDNVSTDDSHKKCKERFEKIQLIENSENFGYCEGNNIGIKKSKGEYIVILNPDTIVNSDWLEKLFEAYKKNGEGLYQPKLLTSFDKKRINSLGNMINIFGFGYSKGKGTIDKDELNEIEEIGYASGACLFTSIDVFKKIGLFDSFLFAYHDDLDLGWRAHHLGIKSYIVSTAIVFHAESFSFKWSKKKFYLLERNRWYCLLTHYSRRTFFKILPSLILIEIIVFFYYISKGMIKEKILGYSNLIANRKLIQKKYHELESKKKIPDSILVKNFQDKIEAPKEISGTINSSFFNSMLKGLSKLSRLIL